MKNYWQYYRQSVLWSLQQHQIEALFYLYLCHSSAIDPSGGSRYLQHTVFSLLSVCESRCSWLSGTTSPCSWRTWHWSALSSAPRLVSPPTPRLPWWRPGKRLPTLKWVRSAAFFTLNNSLTECDYQQYQIILPHMYLLTLSSKATYNESVQHWPRRKHSTSN